MKTATPIRRQLWIRRIVRLTWIVSLLLIIAAWYNSYQRFEAFEHRTEIFRIEDESDQTFSFNSSQGVFTFVYTSSWSNHIPTYRQILSKNPHLRNESAWRHILIPQDLDPPTMLHAGEMGNLGFSLSHKHSGSSASGVVTGYFAAGAPYWAILLALGVPLVVGLILRARANRMANMRQSLGQCVGCGYDMRATPGRCPECGMEAAA